MRLDAARKSKRRIQVNIKDALHDYVIQLANRPADGIWKKNKPAVPLLSVGIALGESTSDHKVAIRISRHGNRIDLLNAIVAKCGYGDIDIRYVGRIYPVGTSPVVIQSSGSSVSHYLTGTGTIGCPVVDLSSGLQGLLSNNHVIGFENDAAPGDAIIDPGRDDGGSAPANAIGRFTRCVKLDFGGGPNSVDAALATLAPGFRLAPPASPDFSYDPQLGIAVVAKSSVVKKLGRSTGLTVGSVTAVEMGGFFVDYQNGPALFEHQIEVTGIGTPFAAHGDSGALVVNDRGAAIGLLFAVSEAGIAYVNPIGQVLSQLGVVLA